MDSEGAPTQNGGRTADVFGGRAEFCLTTPHLLRCCHGVPTETPTEPRTRDVGGSQTGRRRGLGGELPSDTSPGSETPQTSSQGSTGRGWRWGALLSRRRLRPWDVVDWAVWRGAPRGVRGQGPGVKWSGAVWPDSGLSSVPGARTAQEFVRWCTEVSRRPVAAGRTPTGFSHFLVLWHYGPPRRGLWFSTSVGCKSGSPRAPKPGHPTPLRQRPVP